MYLFSSHFAFICHIYGIGINLEPFQECLFPLSVYKSLDLLVNPHFSLNPSNPQILCGFLTEIHGFC